jgi:hypothetical protein
MLTVLGVRARLPARENGQPSAARADLVRLRDYIIRLVPRSDAWLLFGYGSAVLSFFYIDGMDGEQSPQGCIHSSYPV